MTKKEMAQKLAKECDLSQQKALEVLTTLFDATDGQGIIAQELDGEHKVTIPGFGTFSTRERAERQGKNPANGETITIPKRRYVHFSPGKTLKERIQAGAVKPAPKKKK